LIKAKQGMIDELEDRVSETETAIQVVSDNILSLSAQIEDHDKVSKRKLKLRQMETDLETKIRKFKKEISFFHDHDNCPTCRQGIDHGFKDIISDKSGGCVFLLHGPPGVGKTLTCEAISEHLHKPLYSVTVGELGTTAVDLERKLNRILEVADSWKAVILIDEADVFMEKRNTQNIERNAMVGIFLRLLERYHGIMFLTTNRASELDDAFRSRISMIIPFKEFDISTRIKVWQNLLKCAGFNMPDTDINLLADTHAINGRQIKNAIRLVQCMKHDGFDRISLDLKSDIDYFNYVIKMI
jgi:SpoVK/Ycf46/Vps4 family AAA+-type ATPase